MRESKQERWSDRKIEELLVLWRNSPVAPAFLLSVAPSLCQALSPSQLAEACGIAIIYETLPLAFGRVIYLAEASLQPACITVNTTAIAHLSAAVWQAPAEQRSWFTETTITEVAIAHELYHILAQQPSSPMVEVAAHQFAQALTGLPFSPHVYEAVLRRTAGCRTTKNIT